MKPRDMLCFILLSLPGLSQAAETLCMQKEKDIQHEITLAKQHDNQRRVNGLERALTEVRASCTDAKLKAAHQERIAAKQKEVAEREQDLRDAREKGDKDKIAKREAKLQEERHELQQLRAAPW